MIIFAVISEIVIYMHFVVRVLIFFWHLLHFFWHFWHFWIFFGIFGIFGIFFGIFWHFLAFMAFYGIYCIKCHFWHSRHFIFPVSCPSEGGHQFVTMCDDFNLRFFFTRIFLLETIYKKNCIKNLEIQLVCKESIFF
jgi:hypothetical protein